MFNSKVLHTMISTNISIGKNVFDTANDNDELEYNHQFIVETQITINRY